MNCLAKFYWLAELLSKFVQFSIFFIYGLRYNHTTVALSLTKQLNISNLYIILLIMASVEKDKTILSPFNTNYFSPSNR